MEDSGIKKKSLATKLVNDNEDKHGYNGEEDGDDEITMIVRKSTKLLRYKKYGGNKKRKKRKVITENYNCPNAKKRPKFDLKKALKTSI